MSVRSALVIGATGQTGSQILKELLASSQFGRVGEYGRRVTDTQKLGTGKEKLEQKVIDFEKLEPGAWKEGKWDVLFIALGTTRALAGSAAAFEKIDRDYVINAAKAAKVDGLEQRIVYISSMGANPKSSFLYPRSKGLTEEALANLKYSDTIIFRPAFLKGGERPDMRLAETMFGSLTGFFSKFSPNVEIKVPDLAKSARIAGELGSAALPKSAGAITVSNANTFTVISNEGATALSKT